MANPIPGWKRAFNWITTMMCCGMLTREERRPTTDLWINGTKIRCLWDSGADITVCSYETWRKLKYRPPLMRYDTGLTTASGQSIHARGIAKLKMFIGQYETYHEVVVIDNLKTDFIVGVDLMEKHNFVIDLANKRIQRTRKESPASEFTIQAPRNLYLESCEVATIEVKPPLSLRNASEGTKFVVSGEWIPEGLCELNKNKMTKIIIANKTTLPVQFFRGENIGSIEEVRESLTIGELVKNGASVPVNDNNKKGGGITNRKIPQEMIEKACQNVPSQYRNKFSALLQEYSDIFAINSDEIGKCGVIKSRIDLIDPSKIIARPPFRTPHHLSAVVDIYVNKLLKQGVIQKSLSAYSSPLMLVKKPGAFDKNKPLIEQWRIVQDFRLLNLNTHKMKYPVNHIHDLLNRVSQGSYFSTLDLASGFWNQEMEESSRPYTAFSVPGLGHFEWTRTSQGLANSGPYFQKLLDFLISGCENTYVYIDDVIVTSSDLDGQLATLRKVFERFKKYGLKCRISKVNLCARTVNYLGFEINGTSGIRPAELKTKAIREFPEPNSITSVKSWLGLTSFYRRVIPNFSEIARPLTVLTRKDSGYTAGKIPPAAAEAFRILKEKLSTRPCVKPIKFDRDFIVTVDSSAMNTGIILSQVNDQGVEHPCLYASRTHSEQESKRSALKIESEGIIYAMRTLAPIIKGGHTIVRSDHKPLIGLCKQSTPILDRIHAELEEFSYEMIYLKGDHMPSDALSRVQPPNHDNCLLCTKNKTELNIISSTVPKRIETLSQPKRHELLLHELREAKKSSEPLISGLTGQQVIELQKDDHLCKAIVCWLRYNILPNAFELRQAVLKYGYYARIENGMLGIIDNNKFRILAPFALRQTLMHLSHDHELSGHLGSMKTIERLKSWIWPNIDSEVKSYISSCIKCNQNNPPSAYTRMPLRTLPQTVRMGQRIHLDLIGPYPHSGELNYKYALVMCDSYTSYIKIVPIVSKEASVVAKAFLTSWITSLGIPEAVTVDQGSEYTAKIFRELCKLLKIELKYVNINHAQANAQIERQNRNILTYIRKYIEENDKEWSSMMPHISFAMNTSVHTDKHRSPFEMLYARKPVTVSNYIGNKYSEDEFENLLDRHFQIVQQVREDKKQAFITHKKSFDKRAHSQTYIPGDCIYIGHMQKAGMHRKMQRIFDGPYIVTKNLSYDTIQAEHMVSGKRIIAHKNRTKPASAPQQFWREAGKADLHLPQPQPSNIYGAHPANERPATAINEGAMKSYGYGVANDGDGSDGDGSDGVDDAKSECDVDGDDVTKNYSQQTAQQTSVPRPVTSPRQTKFFYGPSGPMTRARFKALKDAPQG